jgi:hypothetical protein
MVLSDDKYKVYKEEVQKYEQRQEKIKMFKKQMGEILRENYPCYTFKYTKNQVIFSIYRDCKVKISVAECSKEDKYDKDLGKIIAVFKAFNMPIDEVVDLVEPKYATGGYISFEEIGKIFSNSLQNKGVAF